MNIKQVIAEMTLEEKCSLLSGRDFWNLKSIDRLGIESVMVSDGPHGLRKQAAAGDHLGINDSIPAVCFPTASASAASFDREALYKIGEGVGEACQAENLSVILGPGVNIKRSPLCGRNFEYFSEDPYWQANWRQIWSKVYKAKISAHRSNILRATAKNIGECPPTA